MPGCLQQYGKIETFLLNLTFRCTRLSGDGECRLLDLCGDPHGLQSLQILSLAEPAGSPRTGRVHGREPLCSLRIFNKGW